MGIRIICDSASDIKREIAEEMKIDVLPLKIYFGNEEYLDGVNITHEEFYEKLQKADSLPTTSQVSPYDYEKIFKEAVDSGDTVICITLSAKLSGCNQSAHIAGDDFEDNIYIVDSENVCLGEQILVELAVNLREEGKSAKEIVDILEVEKKKIHIAAVIDTLDFLKKGGRISSAAAFSGNLLSIKPVVGVVDGEVKVLGKGRGRKKGNSILNKLIDKDGGIDFNKPLRLGYSGISREQLDKYIKDSSDIYTNHNIKVSTIGSTIGTHAGPGIVALAFFNI